MSEPAHCGTCFGDLEGGRRYPCDSVAATRAAYLSHFTPQGAQETDMLKAEPKEQPTEQPKRGRKKRAAALVERHRSIRINDQKWAKIQAAAKKAGKPTTTWARDVLEAASEPA